MDSAVNDRKTGFPVFLYIIYRGYINSGAGGNKPSVFKSNLIIYLLKTCVIYNLCKSFKLLLGLG